MLKNTESLYKQHNQSLFEKNGKGAFDRKLTRVPLDECFELDSLGVQKYKVKRDEKSDQWVRNRKPYERFKEHALNSSSLNRKTHNANLKTINSAVNVTIDAPNMEPISKGQPLPQVKNTLNLLDDAPRKLSVKATPSPKAVKYNKKTLKMKLNSSMKSCARGGLYSKIKHKASIQSQDSDSDSSLEYHGVKIKKFQDILDLFSKKQFWNKHEDLSGGKKSLNEDLKHEFVAALKHSNQKKVFINMAQRKDRWKSSFGDKLLLMDIIDQSNAD